MSYTADYWHEWLAHGDFPDHPWRQYLQRSALTLKGLTYAPTGAMCAASTTSLPETPGGERNWDYRYSWIRDSAFMLWGLHSLGFTQEAGDYYYFIEDVARRRTTCRCSTASAASASIEEHELDHLEGYEQLAAGARRQRRVQPEPARRLGHAAGLGLHPHEEPRPASRVGLADPRALRSRRRSSTGASPTAASGRCAASRKHFTSSKIFCWLACDRGARLARLRERHEHGRPLAGGRRRDPRRRPEQRRRPEAARFVQHYDSDALDAALLLIPLVRFLPPATTSSSATPSTGSPRS